MCCVYNDFSTHDNQRFSLPPLYRSRASVWSAEEFFFNVLLSSIFNHVSTKPAIAPVSHNSTLNPINVAGFQIIVTFPFNCHMLSDESAVGSFTSISMSRVFRKYAFSHSTLRGNQEFQIHWKNTHGFDFGGSYLNNYQITANMSYYMLVGWIVYGTLGH